MVAASMGCIYSLVGVRLKLIRGPILVCGDLDFGPWCLDLVLFGNYLELCLQCKHVVDQFVLDSISWNWKQTRERINMWGRSLIGVRETTGRSGETSTGKTDVPSGEKRKLELLRADGQDRVILGIIGLDENIKLP
jgi:hypothetical protein